jgi:hypothetical protein
VSHCNVASIWRVVALGMLSAFGATGHAASPGSPPLNWYRGNTHAHTLNADGDATPDVVARWYREHGYQFLFITDHEFLTDVAPLNALYGAQEKFLVLAGQEVTQMLGDVKTPEKIQHPHVNALGSRSLVMPLRGADGLPPKEGVSIADTYVRNIAAIRAAGGIPQVNHPTSFGSIQPSDLSGATGTFLLEVWNGHPTANNLGGTDDGGAYVPSAEELWDALLSQGKTVWAVGSDDSHVYLRPDDLNSERPGKAWITVRAPKLTPEAILDAIRKGDFYASNGVILQDYSADERAIAITLQQPPGPRGIKNYRRFTTRFIGNNGRILAEVGGMKPRYEIRGDEGYVRASIIDSNGARAWTQPVFLQAQAARHADDRAKTAATPADGVAPSLSTTVDRDGTVHVKSLSVPFSSLASEEARESFIATAVGRAPLLSADMDISERRRIVDEQIGMPIVKRWKSRFPVTITDETMGGVRTDVVVPAEGVAEKNRDRVLINLHGGDFIFGARYGVLGRASQKRIPSMAVGIGESLVSVRNGCRG